MALAPQKIVQSYIQALLQVVNLVQQANTLGQSYKAKFVAKNPDLSNAPLTAGQITAVNSFLTDLNTLATGVVATTVKSKDIPSHGTGALD